MNQPLATSAPDPNAIPGRAPHSANPILPGYYADPSIVQDGGKTYIYATLDPWGGETLGCWESPDFKNWTYQVLNWPTKAACTSRTSGTAQVWAPSVVRVPDSRFLMAVSVGGEVWLGVAKHPLGPWENILGDEPFIRGDCKPGFHMIDAELFVDDDKSVYVYWGSGLEWKDGKCWVVKLKPDLTGFDGEEKEVTPANYFEAPFMVKRQGKYFLTYSQGITIEDTYQVHYAVGDNPYGPFTEADNSPILVTDKSANVISPGHHAVFRCDGRDYILYHRHSIPFNPKFIGRQTCVDELHIGADGRIARVAPTHQGPPLVQGRVEAQAELAVGAKVIASSQADDFTAPACVLDDNYATRWAAAANAKGAWIQIDLGAAKQVSRQLIRPEYAWKPYRFTAQASTDSKSWLTLADFTKQPANGSPMEIGKPVAAQYLRLVFPDDVKGTDISLLEWTVL
jgi:arabinoxylan arabinofuranohydrolase